MSATMVPIGFIIVFLLICARYAALAQLWGDEAYSLNVASQSLDAILAADPFHLPTYYFALHLIVPFFPVGLEWPLRLIHALIFCIGLCFCWLIARAMLGRGWALRGVMALTIVLPSYIFYATNIRMYALLFAASQAFLWTTFRLLEPSGEKGRMLAWHLLMASLCALVDWPGFLLVGITWTAILALKGPSFLARHDRSRLPIIGLVGLSLLVGLVLLWEPLQRVILEWPNQQMGASGGLALRC